MPNYFSSEHAFHYDSYTFGYACYASRIGDEPLDEIYVQGFLPYSGNPDLSSELIFYRARSGRVNLASFELSSENRRIIKKMADKKFFCDGKIRFGMCRG